MSSDSADPATPATSHVDDALQNSVPAPPLNSNEAASKVVLCSLDT